MTLPAPTSIRLFTCSTAPRVSALTLSGFFKTVVGGRRRWRRSKSLVLCASMPLGMAEPIDEKKSSFNCAQAPAEICASTSENDQEKMTTYRTFLEARTEKDLLLGIQKEVEAGRLPLDIAEGMEELYHNYRNAVFHSGNPKAHEIILANMAVALDRIFMDVGFPYQFSPHHQAIREPFDYYLFGQKYISPLIDFRNSFIGNISLFSEMEKKLHQGENVILISNHQTEADPAVVALLLEPTNPFIAENIIYVAGDRVITDPLCKPFSMGRNLLCVHSKKHMNDDPELTEIKRRANTKSLKEMAVLLRGGSKIIWIAPSGGRDRPDPVSKEWFPAPFDASSVDNMRRLAEHAGVPANIYPLAIMCYDIMPPPPKVEKDIGEKRVLSFHGVGLSAAPRVSYQDVAAALDDPEEAKSVYSHLLYSSICEQYKILDSAIHRKQGLQASTPTVTLSEPWR